MRTYYLYYNNTSTSIISTDKAFGFPVRCVSERESEITAYNTGTLLTGSPFLGVYGGRYDFYNGGTNGLYWSSTAGNSDGAYRLDYNSTNAGAYNGYKRFGFSVRCVSEENRYLQYRYFTHWFTFPRGLWGALRWQYFL